MKRKSAVALFLIVCLGMVLFPLSITAGEAARLTVLSTTFPIYQITRNVMAGREGVKVDLLLSSQLGCPHDYALTPQDMLRLAKADILVVNGFGMEEFLGAPVKKANPKIIVIDSSVGIKETMAYAGEHSHDHAKDQKHAREPEHDDAHHHHAGVNPHLFASPRMTALLAMNIAAGLAAADPTGAAVYDGNARTYAQAMNRLADEMAALGRGLKNHRIVQPHGVFDYLARDMGLEVVAVMQPHGREPSAAEMMQLVKIIREKRAGAIFTELQYPEKVGNLLGKETGVPVAMLDPGAGGPENAPLTYYETVMRQNMKTLAETLGVK